MVDPGAACPPADQLALVAAGGLGAADAAAVRAHLADCARCREGLARLAGAAVPAGTLSMGPTVLAPTGAPPATRPPEPPGSGAFDARYRAGVELGRGGMGRVLVAEDAHLRREVVIKELLRADAGLIRRFEREALLTARLQHPGIVSVYEFGHHADGLPALVMRRVRGRPLDEVLAGARTLDARLALLPRLLAACEAVAYAHQAGVIHRDLKPANVLVGDFGETVVIDWGLAKDVSLDEADGAGSVTLPPALAEDLTLAGSVLGTPAYMPPEQATGQPADARSDVYSLGAILYHLLAGRRPHDGKLPEVLAALRAGQRPPELHSVVRGVPPDLVAVVDRALATVPADRYAHAGELAADLGRFQTGQLVSAHQYSLRQRLRRFARRHAAPLAVAGLALVLLVALAGVGLGRIVAERDRANREAAAAARVSRFLTDMFTLSDPGETKGSRVTARELLDRAAQEVGGLAGEPLLQARMMFTIGDVYARLGLFARSRPLVTRAAAVQTRLLGPEAPETLTTLRLAATLDVNYQARARELERILALERGVLAPDDVELATTLVTLGLTLTDLTRSVESERLLTEAYELRRRLLGPGHRETLKASHGVAVALFDQGRWSEAERRLRADLEVLERTRPDDPFTVLVRLDLGFALGGEGRAAEAERIQRAGVEYARKVFDPDHPAILNSLQQLGGSLTRLGRYAEAEKVLRESYEGYLRISPPDAAYPLQDLGWALVCDGRFAEAEALLGPALVQARQRLGPVNTVTLNLGSALAQALVSLGRADEAAPLILEAIAGWAGLSRADQVNAQRSLLGQVLIDAGRPVDARRLLEETLAAEQRARELDGGEVATTLTRLAHVLGEPGHAAAAGQLLRQALELTLRAHGARDPRTVAGELELVRHAARAGRRDEALAWLAAAGSHGLTADQAERLAGEDTLAPLRGDPRFAAVLAAARQRAAQP